MTAELRGYLTNAHVYMLVHADHIWPACAAP